MAADVKQHSVEALAELTADADVLNHSVEALADIVADADVLQFSIEILCDYHEGPAGRAFLVPLP